MERLSVYNIMFRLAFCGENEILKRREKARGKRKRSRKKRRRK